MKKLTGMILIICIFILPRESQSQERIWVLWSKIEGFSAVESQKNEDEDWQIEQTFDNKELCIAKLKSAVESKALDMNHMISKESPGLRGEVLVNSNDTSGTVQLTVKTSENNKLKNMMIFTDRYRCLPTGIDPKEKK